MSLPLFRQHHARRRVGFTLTEMVVALLVLALIGSMVFVSHQAVADRARDDAAIVELRTLFDGAYANARYHGRLAVSYDDFIAEAEQATAAEQVVLATTGPTDSRTDRITLIPYDQSSEEWGVVSLGITSAEETTSMAMRSRSGRCAMMLLGPDGVELLSEAKPIAVGGCRAEVTGSISSDPPPEEIDDGGNPGTPSTPTTSLVIAASGGVDQFVVTWDEPADPVASYRLAYTDQMGGSASITGDPATLCAGTCGWVVPADESRIYNILLSAEQTDLTLVSNTTQATTAPAAPSPTASPDGTAITIDWASVALADTYQVTRGPASTTPAGSRTAVSCADAAAPTCTDTSVTGGETWFYWVAAVNTAGAKTGGPTSATANDVLVDPTATGVDDDIEITWTGDADAVSWEVLRAPSGDGRAAATSLATLPAGSTAYTDTPPAAGASYDYWLEATDSLGTVYTAPEQIARTRPAVPAAPTATAASTTAMDLEIQPAVGADEYQLVSRVTGSGDPFTAITAWTTTLTHTDTGLVPATSYDYRVHARNESGTSVGATATASTNQPLPGAPVLTAGVVDRDADLTWTTPSGSPTAYHLQRSPSGAGTWADAYTGAATAHTDASLPAATSYDYRVRASNAAGDGPWSATQTITTRPDTPPAPTASATGETAVQVDLTTTAAADEYQVYWRLGGTADPFVALTGWTTTLTHAHTGLAPGTDYDYRVAARNAAGSSPMSPVASATTPADPPTGPTTISATEDVAAIDVTWDTATDASGIAGYTLQRCTGAGCTSGWSTIASPGPASTSHSDATVVDSTTYRYRVRATDNQGLTGAWATSADQAYDVPTVVLSATPGDGQVELTWPTTADDGSGVASHTLQRCTGAGCTSGWSTIASPGPASTSHTDSTAVNGTVYRYRLRATDNAGNVGPWDTTDDQAPGIAAPTNLTTTVGAYDASSVANDVRLTWDTVAGATTYGVYRCDGSSCTPATLIGTPAAGGGASQTFDDLDRPNGDFTYHVVATDGVDLSDPSNTATATLALEAMVLTVDTTLDGVATGTALALGGVDALVDWGDGSALQAISGNGPFLHNYSTAGTKTIRVYGTATTYSSPLYGNDEEDDLLSVDAWGTIGISNLVDAFFHASNLTSVPNTTAGLGTVTSLQGTFRSAESFNSPLDGWDVSNVVSLQETFDGALAFNQPLATWDTSSVTTMYETFSGLGSTRKSSFNQDISGWNTANVTDFFATFKDTAAFNADLSGWDTSAATTMSRMFYRADAFDQPIGSWTTSSVTDMSEMFQSAQVFNQDLSAWDTSSVTDMSQMFQSAPAFNGAVEGWVTSSVTDMRLMFDGAAAFNQPIGAWDTSAVTDMSSMLRGTTAFNQPIGTWNTNAVTNMGTMFYRASAFNQPIGTWNTASVTNMGLMFYEALSFDQELHTWDVSAVTSCFSFDTGAGAWWEPHQQFDPTALGCETLDAPTSVTATLVDADADGQVDDARISWDRMRGALDYSVEGCTGAGCTPALAAGTVAHSTSATSSFDVLDLANGTTYRWHVITRNGPIVSPASAVVELEYLSEPLLMTWDTTLPGAATARQVSLALEGADGWVDWGDGSPLEAISGNGPFSHTYAVDGVYQTAFHGTANAYDAWAAGGSNQGRLTSVDDWGKTGMASLSSAFGSSENLTSVPSNLPPTVTDTSWMFAWATSFNGSGVSTWDMSNVMNADAMFTEARAFNQPLNSWDVSGLTSLYAMFWDAHSFNQDLDMWDVSNVTTMDTLFTDALAFNGDVTTWDVSNVTDFSATFDSADAFNRDITGWNVSSAVQMNQMFARTDAFNQPIGVWNVSSVQDFRFMFTATSAFNQPLDSWTTTSATNMASMFSGAQGFNQPIGSWDTTGVANMSRMFHNTAAFSQDLSTWDTSSLVWAQRMFAGAQAFNGNISTWNTSSLQDADFMFENATAFDQELHTWDVSAVTACTDFDIGATNWWEPHQQFDPTALGCETLDAPTSVTATLVDADADGQVDDARISWDRMRGALDYSVEGCTGAGCTPALAAGTVAHSTSATSSIDVLDLANGTTYRWHVITRNGPIVSPPSAVVELTYTDTDPPAAPALSGTATDGSNSLSWNEPGDPSGIAGYQLQRREGYAHEVMADNPRGYWRFSGASTTDHSGSGNHGMADGGVTFGTAGPISSTTDTAATFDGTDDHVVVPDSPSVSITGDQTISMWIRPTDTSVRRNPIAKAYSGEGTLTLETNGTVNYYYGTGGGNCCGSGTYQSLNTGTPLPLNTWSHIAIVRDLTNMQLRWYVNGVETNSAAASFAAAADSSLPLTIGSGYVNNFAGSLDDVALYASALDAADIARHYSRNTLAGDTWTTISTPSGGTTSHDDNSLVNDNRYQYRIMATDGVGNPSAWSNVVELAYTESTPPTAPALSGTAANASTSLAWTASTDLSGIAGYQLQRRDGYAHEVMADNPVGYWRLAEAADARDHSGSGNHGTESGGVTFGTAGPISSTTDTAATFDGSNDHVVVPDSPSVSITGDQTISMWIRPTDTSVRRNPIAKAYSGEGTITLETNGTLRYFYGTAAANCCSGTYQGFSSVASIPLNTWTHVAVVRDLTNMQLRWYVNGVETNSAAASFAAAADSSLPLTIGSGYVNNFAGSLDDVALYASALDAADIARHYGSRTLAGAAWSPVAAPSGTAHDDAPLVNDTSYQYRVQAIDGVGNPSAWSNVVELTPTAAPMVLTYDTSITSTAPANHVEVPLTGVSYATVDWGDGTAETISGDGPFGHTYAAAGTYTVQIDGSATTLSDMAGNYYGDRIQAVNQWGDLGLTASVAGLYNEQGLVDVPDNIPATMTSLESLFLATPIFNDPDVALWDVSQVTNFSQAFALSGFDQDLSGWTIPTTQPVTMYYMFSNTPFNQPIGTWETGSVTDMAGMFSNTPFNQPIDTWDTSSVTNMGLMFSGATAFNQDISGWDTSSVTDTRAMFRDAAAFNQDISGWDTSNVTTMQSMFERATTFDQPLHTLDTSAITTCIYHDRDASAWWEPRPQFDPVGLGCETLDSPTNPTIAVTDAAGDGQVNDVALEWDRMRGALAYDIAYCSGSGCTPSLVIGVVPKSTASRAVFTHDNVPGGINRYRIRTTNGPVLSGWSAVLEVTAGTVQFVSAPSSLTATVGAYDAPVTPNDVELTWATSPEASSYEIYRCDGGACTPDTLVATVPDTGGASESWVDVQRIHGRTYTYHVIGTDGFNDSAPSPTATASIVVTPMRMVYNTSLPGTPARTITLPHRGLSALVDWGDGNQQELTGDGPFTHTYAADGTYTVRVHGAAVDMRANDENTRDRLTSVVSWGQIGINTLAFAFFNNANLTNVPATLDGLDPAMTSLFHTFEDATSFNDDLSGWDTSNITSMSAAFQGANSFNGNVTTWNTSSVTSMTGMFQAAGGTSRVDYHAFNQDISGWDTASVTTMSSMFRRSHFNQDISGWDTSSLNQASSMFLDNPSFNQNISGWDVSGVTSMNQMFYLAETFNRNLSGWTVGNVSFCTDFDTGATSWTLPKPNFTACTP